MNKNIVAVVASCALVAGGGVAVAHSNNGTHTHEYTVEASIDGRRIDRCVAVAGEPALRCEVPPNPQFAANVLCKFHGYDQVKSSALKNIQIQRVPEGVPVSVMTVNISVQPWTDFGHSPHPVSSGHKDVLDGDVTCLKKYDDGDPEHH